MWGRGKRLRGIGRGAVINLGWFSGRHDLGEGIMERGGGICYIHVKFKFYVN